MHLNTHSIVILIIMINKNKNDFSVIKSDVFQLCLAYTVGVKEITITSRAVTLVHPNVFFRSKL